MSLPTVCSPGPGMSLPAPQLATAPLSKQLIRRRFDKASQSYQAHNSVQQRIAQALLTMMAGQAQSYQVLLDLGCGPGPDWHQLTRHCQQYIGIDLSAAMLNEHHSRQGNANGHPSWLLQADMECLPLPTDSVDTLYSSMAMQWADSRQRLGEELKRVLKPGANAFISVPLQGSLQPLADIRQAIDNQPQVNPQPQLQDWLDDLSIAGWTIQAVEQRCFIEYFADIKALLHSIKGVGAGANQAAPLTRATLQTLNEKYEQHRTELGLPLKYEVGLLQMRPSS
ncbi:MAG: methyltransferase domain-containing protein [Idiomarina sp.]|nr:methyltransferase domain-containing protein [Idiomarina sp.]